MPEEKKKESFTFSDKIQSSKQTASKSFAKRSSSKIGRDGKPKQTILERTKRDAPFLIAALVALLLLPFLYKYSGSVNEEAIITPGSEETAFDPERYAFAPDVENPEGEIAQLSGRDSLSLIKGWGSDDDAAYASKDDYNYDYEANAQRDAYKESASDKKAREDTNVDIEENTTNIYKKRARVGTRAAFKRAATPIGSLKGASLASGKGDPFRVGNWGGSLRGGAKPKTSKPKDSPKPVSLQPLQAAARPSRTSFGNPAAAMRQAKDALGKHDAQRAILDAQVKPVEPGSFGGLTSGEARFGGGAGNFDRKFNYQGKEPWWWDLMKTRSQAVWQHKMERKWQWEGWMDKLAQNILGGLLNCLITGNSDGDVDHFLGATAGSGSAPKCCGLNEDQFKIQYAAAYAAAGGSFKAACDGVRKGDKGKKDCPSGWDPGTKAEADMNFFQVRGNCLGLAVGGRYGKGEPKLDPGFPCVETSTIRHYSLRPTGKAMKWNRYHYVVVRNYVPYDFEQGARTRDANSAVQKASKKMSLCSVYDNNLRMDKESSAGLSAMYNLSAADRAHLEAMEDLIPTAERIARTDPAERDYEPYPSTKVQTASDLRREMKDYAVAHANSAYKENNNAWYGTEEFDPEALDDACVIYLAHGDMLDWEKGFKPQVIELLAGMIKKNNIPTGDLSLVQAAEKMFRQLDLLFVEGMASSKTISHRKHTMENLPMPYWQFYESYIVRYGTTGKKNDTGSRANVSDRKFRTEDDTIVGARCYFNNSISIVCDDNSDPITATVTFHSESYRGGRGMEGGDAINEKDNVRVTAQFIPLGGEVMGVEQKFYGPKDASGVSRNQLIYTFDGKKILTDGKEFKGEEGEVRGKVVWRLFRGSGPEAVSVATCDVGTAGDTYSEGVKECEDPAEIDTNPKCCAKAHPGWIIIDGKCQEPRQECKKGDEQKSERCCRELMGPGYKWRESPEPRCYKDEQIPEPPPPPTPTEKKETRLAQVIKWVSADPTNRKSVPGKEPTKDTFGNDLVKPAQNDTTKYNQHCSLEEMLVMNSDAAAKFVRTVVSAYNKCYASDIAAGKKPILSDKFKNGNDYPNDAEYIDALNIAVGLAKSCPAGQNVLNAQEKNALVHTPASAACELGRDMVRMSRDQHVGHKNSVKKVPYRNDLGAFLAYVHPTSILYPATKYFGSCDERFQSKYAGDGGCAQSASQNNVPNAYHHNNYNNIGVANIYTKRYEPSLRELGIKVGEGFPMKELVEKPQTSAAASCRALASKYQNCGKCYKQVNAYNSDGGCALMYRDVQEGKGQACVAFAGTAEMTNSKVLEYVQAVCKAGLYRKPWGVGNKDKAQKPSKKTSGQTRDRGVEQEGK